MKDILLAAALLGSFIVVYIVVMVLAKYTDRVFREYQKQRKPDQRVFLNETEEERTPAVLKFLRLWKNRARRKKRSSAVEKENSL